MFMSLPLPPGSPAGETPQQHRIKDDLIATDAARGTTNFSNSRSSPGQQAAKSSLPITNVLQKDNGTHTTADQPAATLPSPEHQNQSTTSMESTISDSELASTEELRLQPFAYQVGGQSTVLAVDSNTICKPMISREARFYQRAPEGLTPFIPQYKGELKVRFVRQNSGAINFVAMDPDPKLNIRRAAMRAKSSAVLTEYQRDNSKATDLAALRPPKFNSSISTREEISSSQQGEQQEQQELDEPPYRGRCFSCSSNASIPSAAASNLDAPSGSSHNDTEDDGEADYSYSNSLTRDNTVRRQSIGAVDSSNTKKSLTSKRHSSAVPILTSSISGSYLTVPSRSTNAIDNEYITGDSESPLVHHTITAIAPIITETVASSGTSSVVPKSLTDAVGKLSVGSSAGQAITDHRMQLFRAAKGVATRGSTASLPGLGTSPPDIDRGGGLTGLKSWSVQCQEKTIAKLGVQVGDDVKKFILLENVASNYQIPCILDLKMGIRQHGDSADEEKRRKQIAKCEATTSKTLGVRACGMQVYRHDAGCYNTYDKYYGRSLSVDGFKHALRNFLDNGNRIRVDLIPAFLRKLRALEEVVSRLDGYRFYSSSLLMMYDGRESTPRDSIASAAAPHSRQLSLSSPDHGVEFDAEELHDDDEQHLPFSDSAAERFHRDNCSCCCKCRCACHSTDAAPSQSGNAAALPVSLSKTLEALPPADKKSKPDKARMWTPLAPPITAAVMTTSEQLAADSVVDVRMIDFAHTSLPRTLRTQQSITSNNNNMPPSPTFSSSVLSGGTAPAMLIGQAALAENVGPDSGYLFGLSNLIKLFEELLEQEEDQQSSPVSGVFVAQHETVIPSTPPLSAGLDKPLTFLDDEADRLARLNSPTDAETSDTTLVGPF